MTNAVLNLPQKKRKYFYTCRPYLLGLACLIVTLPALAEDISHPPAAGSHTRSEEVRPQKAPPSLPSDAQPSDDSRNLPKTDVKIIHEKERTIEEYRVGGKIRYIKITPRHGKPYYLVDRDGDGIAETYYGPFKGPAPINQWLLLKW